MTQHPPQHTSMADTIPNGMQIHTDVRLIVQAVQVVQKNQCLRTFLIVNRVMPNARDLLLCHYPDATMTTAGHSV